MSTDRDIWTTPVAFPDPEAAREALADIFTHAVKAAHLATERALDPATAVAFDPSDKAEAVLKFGLSMMSQPSRLAEMQLKAWNEWSNLWTSTLQRLAGQEASSLIEPERGDRRFSDPTWSSDPFFRHLKESYLLASRQLNDLVHDADDLDPETRKRVSFMVRQYVDAVAPTNFVATNPEAMRRTLETGGANLLTGLANLLADAASGKGIVERRSADNFELGVNIAATPGSVVFQNDLFQLIQYAPSTEMVSRRPLLYVPPLVNKYYLFDLQPKSSLLKWLVDQGRTVFVISWINPDESLRAKDFASYLIEGVATAVDAVSRATGEPDVDVAAFCMGGTLAAATAAYLAGSGQGAKIGSLTLIGVLLDFSELGEWSVFSSPGDRKALQRALDSKGYVESHDLQKLFSIMRANDLIWSSVVNHYLLDKEAPASDILYWFSDGARIPAAFLVSYGELLMAGNKLCEPGAIVVNGVPLDLGKVTAPVTVLSLKDDHVSAWAATYRGAKLFGGPSRFVLGGSGHNAGVINPPAANKHGYWLNEDLPESPDAWMEGAEKHVGSWWPNWQAWLTTLDAAQAPARSPGAGGLPILEPAPGSYVRMR